MAEEIISKRYAKSLISVTSNIEELEKFRDELIVLNEAIMQLPKFRSLVNNPGIAESIKHDIFKRTFKSILDPRIYNFLFIILKRRRFKLLPMILKEFKIELDTLMGRHLAEFTTAIALRQTHKEEIVKKIEAMTGYKLDPEFYVDPEILGGIFIKIDDTAIDARVSRSISEIRRSLMENKKLLEHI